MRLKGSEDNVTVTEDALMYVLDEMETMMADDSWEPQYHESIDAYELIRQEFKDSQDERKTFTHDGWNIVPLTKNSTGDWALHNADSSIIITFDSVSRMESGGLHLWLRGGVIMFLAEDGDVPDPIVEEIIRIKEEYYE